MSAHERTEIVDDNLCEIKQQLDTAVRGVDGHKIENIQIGHTKIHHNTAIILGDEDEEGELKDIFDNEEGFVVYIAIKYKKIDNKVSALNLEKEHGDVIPSLDKGDITPGGDVEEEKEETMTEPKQKEKIDEKIAKYGREEANRKGDVGREISCSSEDYPKYVDRESRQDL